MIDSLMLPRAMVQAPRASAAPRIVRSIQPSARPVAVAVRPAAVTQRPVVAAPRPVGIAPRPTVSTPRPVVAAPRPAVAAPRPVAMAPGATILPSLVTPPLPQAERTAASPVGLSFDPSSLVHGSASAASESPFLEEDAAPVAYQEFQAVELAPEQGERATIGAAVELPDWLIIAGAAVAAGAVGWMMWRRHKGQAA